MKHILSPRNINELGKHLHSQNKKIVLVGGCFDIIHIGHISLLENAKKLGDKLVVFLESDQTIKDMKGDQRPLHTQIQRANILKALSVVDFVVLLTPNMTNSEYDELTKLLRPDIIATTKNDLGLEHKNRQARLTGAQVVFANEQIQDVSTSKIISALHKEI